MKKKIAPWPSINTAIKAGDFVLAARLAQTHLTGDELDREIGRIIDLACRARLGNDTTEQEVLPENPAAEFDNGRRETLPNIPALTQFSGPQAEA